jgi:hypothetical protein
MAEEMDHKKSGELSPTMQEEIVALLRPLSLGQRYKALNALAEKGFVVKIVLRVDDEDIFHESINIYSQEEAKSMTF